MEGKKKGGWGGGGGGGVASRRGPSHPRCKFRLLVQLLLVLDAPDLRARSVTCSAFRVALTGEMSGGRGVRDPIPEPFFVFFFTGGTPHTMPLV